MNSLINWIRYKWACRGCLYPAKKSRLRNQICKKIAGIIEISLVYEVSMLEEYPLGWTKFRTSLLKSKYKYSWSNATLIQVKVAQSFSLVKYKFN